MKSKNELVNANFLKTICRQCNSAITSKTLYCPMCGLFRPQTKQLNVIEKNYLKYNPSIPVKFENICEHIDPKKSFIQNFIKELAYYMADFQKSNMLIVALTGIFISLLSSFLVSGIWFPYTFVIFWLCMVYAAYDLINFTRAVLIAQTVKRLQYSKKLSPYSTFFKLEYKLEKLLESLSITIISLFENDINKTGAALRNSAENFVKVINILSQQITKYADISMKLATMLWRNNIYSIIAQEGSLKAKIAAINIKIREAEAYILRYKWLLSLTETYTQAEQYIKGIIPEEFKNHKSYCTFIISTYRLSQFDAIGEKFVADFETLPFELPFKSRYYWHQQLPPMPMKSKDFIKNLPKAEELFESIKQVRQLKTKLEEQMILNCASNAVNNISLLDNLGNVTNNEIDLNLYTAYLDLPKFSPDSKEFEEATDKLTAEAKVALGSENYGV